MQKFFYYYNKILFIPMDALVYEIMPKIAPDFSKFLHDQIEKEGSFIRTLYILDGVLLGSFFWCIVISVLFDAWIKPLFD